MDRRRRHPERHLVKGGNSGEVDGDGRDLQSDRHAGPADRAHVHRTPLSGPPPPPPAAASCPSTGGDDSAPPRYRSRTRSSRARLSAVPLSDTLPTVRTTARAATPSAMAAFCSTSRTAVPCSLVARTTGPI